MNMSFDGNCFDAIVQLMLVFTKMTSYWTWWRLKSPASRLFTPLRTVKHYYKTKKPWLTEGLKKSIRRKNKLYHRKQKSKSEEHGQLYKQYRNKLNKLLHLAEQQHYDNLFKENKNNLKSSWQIMKDIISKNKSTSPCFRFYINDSANITNDKKELAENFN